MSGFLFSLRPLTEAARRRAADALSYVEGERTATVEDGPLAGVAVRSDSDELWGAARDPETGVRVWLGGRLALDEPEWAAAERLPYEGGLACRRALDEFLREPASFPAGQNGAFALVVWDPRGQALHVATDRMGYLPVYVWSGADRPALGSHPDVLATAVGATDLDRASMAEAMAWGRALPPHTYYEGVRELKPGTVWSWRGGGAPHVRAYWEPSYRVEPGASARDLTDDLVAALEGAVGRRTLPRLGTAAVLLSGGIDSRAVLYAAHDPTRVTSVTLYSQPNAELATARELARRAGSPHVALQRPFEYYGETAPDAVRVSGGMWNVLDAHFGGFFPEIDAVGAETLLTGCHADFLFKGLTSNRRRRTLFGRALPLYEFAPYRERWQAVRFPVAEPWDRVVRERRAEHFSGLDTADGSDRGRWALELRRVWPLNRTKSISGRLQLQRALRWDPLFADSALIDVYERMPPSLKLNGQVWEQAVARICRTAGDVLNNNSQSPIGASETWKMLYFLYGVAYRKVRRRDLDGTPLGGGHSRGSWPDFDHYLRESRVVPELWAEASPQTTEVLADVLGKDPSNRPVHEWTSKVGPLVSMRTLTLKLWLDQHHGGQAS